MMKKSIFAVLLVLTASAYATQPGNNGEGNGGCGVGQQTNGCGGSPGGSGGAGGTGVGVGIAVANSTSTATAAQQQGQMQSQQQGQSASAAGGSAAGGNATATGNGSGNATSVVVRGAERSAPALGGAVAPVQVRNCRVGIGFGGSNANGAFTAALPLGNDQTCLVGAMLEAMDAAGGFSTKSRQIVACTIEGMDALDECKALKRNSSAAAPPAVALLP